VIPAPAKKVVIVEAVGGKPVELGAMQLRQMVGLNVRTMMQTREAARLARVSLGWLLLQIRHQKKHGQWQAFLREQGIHVKTARRCIDDAMCHAVDMNVCTREDFAAACAKVWPWIFTGRLATLDFELAKWAAEDPAETNTVPPSPKTIDRASVKTLKRDSLSEVKPGYVRVYRQLSPEKRVEAARRVMAAALAGVRCGVITGRRMELIDKGVGLVVHAVWEDRDGGDMDGLEGVGVVGSGGEERAGLAGAARAVKSVT